MIKTENQETVLQQGAIPVSISFFHALEQEGNHVQGLI